jgi:hypothetical protein
MKSQVWGMEELMKYFRTSGEEFGNPEVIELEKPAAFDLRWDANPPLTLRWTWADAYAVRTEPEEGSLLAVGFSGAYEHRSGSFFRSPHLCNLAGTKFTSRMNRFGHGTRERSSARS